ncbi:MAG TPA: tetratricopeptide repeat protein [Candidatus Obscuribacterales bacterium]
MNRRSSIFSRTVLPALVVFALAGAGIASERGESTQVPKRYLYGYQLMQTEHYSQAIEEFNRLIAREPRSFELYDWRGQCYALSEQKDKALKDFDIALKLRPKTSFIYRHRAEAFVVCGEFENALADLRQAVKLSSDDYASLVRMAEVLLMLDRSREAVEYATKAIACRSTQGPASKCYRIRAQAYCHLGEYQKSISDYTNAIAVGSPSYKLLNERGRVYAKARDYKSAEADFTRALKIAPQNKVAGIYMSRAGAREKLGKWKEAQEDRHKGSGIDDFSL